MKAEYYFYYPKVEKFLRTFPEINELPDTYIETTIHDIYAYTEEKEALAKVRLSYLIEIAPFNEKLGEPKLYKREFIEI